MVVGWWVSFYSWVWGVWRVTIIKMGEGVEYVKKRVIGWWIPMGMAGRVGEDKTTVVV